jgi:hypothetical protein
MKPFASRTLSRCSSWENFIGCTGKNKKKNQNKNTRRKAPGWDFGGYLFLKKP